MSELLGAAEIREIAARLGVRPTKQRGQNFVIDGNTVQRIVRTAELAAEDVVVEVGPGLGSLTLALLPHVESVIAIEIDDVLAAELPVTIAKHAPEFAQRLTVITADALDVTELPREPTALVANLPYNVSVPVLLTLLARFPSIQTVLVMVQAEVADRLAAEPNSKVYGVPSVKARWYADVVRAGSIGRNVFWPAPNVDSGLVRLTKTTPRGDDALRDRTFELVDAAFGQRRKTLRAALASYAGGADRAEAALRAAGIDPGARGEQLNVASFVALARAFEESSP